MSTLPEHLQPLNAIIQNIYPDKPDPEEYAEVAFALLQLKGDQVALNAVSDYIQQEYSRKKTRYELLLKLKSELLSWVGWASNWTIRKSGNG